MKKIKGIVLFALMIAFGTLSLCSSASANHQEVEQIYMSIDVNEKIPSSKQVYIIHGYGASPANHWFSWLKEKLSADGIVVDILKMPTPLSPNLNEWLKHLFQNANILTKDTYFVAHSLGCVSLLKHLQQTELKEQIGGLVLVSGFTKSLPSFQLLDEFTQERLDYNRIVDKVKKRAVIASKNDPIVPFSFSKELAAEIHADFYAIENGGHFLESDGFTTLPIVYDVLGNMMGLVD